MSWKKMNWRKYFHEYFPHELWKTLKSNGGLRRENGFFSIKSLSILALKSSFRWHEIETEIWIQRGKERQIEEVRRIRELVKSKMHSSFKMWKLMITITLRGWKIFHWKRHAFLRFIRSSNHFKSKHEHFSSHFLWWKMFFDSEFFSKLLSFWNDAIWTRHSFECVS